MTQPKRFSSVFHSGVPRPPGKSYRLNYKSGSFGAFGAVLHLRKRLKRFTSLDAIHGYEVRPCKDHRTVDLISDALPFGRLWYGAPNEVSNAIGYATHYSRSHDAVMRVYDGAGSVIETIGLLKSDIGQVIK